VRQCPCKTFVPAGKRTGCPRLVVVYWPCLAPCPAPDCDRFAPPRRPPPTGPGPRDTGWLSARPV